MKRDAFLLRIKPGMKDEFKARMKNVWPELADAWKAAGYSNYSIWSVEDYAFGYREVDEAAAPTAEQLAVIDRWIAYMEDVCEYIAKPGTMRMMYHCIGNVREDKSLIRHRVFGTLIKPGCDEEYFRRHQALVDARGDEVPDGPETNFTIWCADGHYNFGYCELVKSYDHEMTEEEKESTIAWETRGLEIMDWITDDCDWIFGGNHPHIECVYQL